MHKKLWKGLLFPLLLVTVIAVGAGFGIGERGSALHSLRREQERTYSKLAHLENCSRQLLDERIRLLTDPKAIERVARQEYGYTGEGELAVDYTSFSKTRGTEPFVRLRPQPWSEFLGDGSYPWQIPLSVFMISLVVLGVLCYFEG
ncbi:MAG: FtsB family cell division protein [Candidatus Brocadiia bacterium]